MATHKIYNGSSWVTGINKTWTGSAWQAVMKFWDGVQWVALGVVGLCTAGASTLTSYSDTTAGGEAARVGAKWDSDGGVYNRVGTTSFGTRFNTWIGSCSNSNYEGRWVKVSGSNPTSSSGSANVWHSMTTDVMVAYDTPADDSLYSGTFRFELRRSSDSVTILTDTFTLFAEEFPED